LTKQIENYINFKKVYYPDEDHFSVPFRASYDAFRHFYDFFQFDEINDLFYGKTTNPTDDLLKLKDHYSMISDRIGCELKPQQGYLNSWAWGIGSGENKELATRMFVYNIELYPDSPNSYTSFGYFLRSLGKHEEAIEQFEKSLQLERNEDVLRTKNETIKELAERNNH